MTQIVSIPELLTVNDALNLYKKDHPKARCCILFVYRK